MKSSNAESNKVKLRLSHGSHTFQCAEADAWGIYQGALAGEKLMIGDDEILVEWALYDEAGNEHWAHADANP